MVVNNRVLITWGYITQIAYNVPIYFPLAYNYICRVGCSLINPKYMYLNIIAVSTSYFTTSCTLSSGQSTSGNIMYISIGF